MKNENGKWLKTELKNPQTGVQINGLSIGDVVYARVTDGTNIYVKSTESVLGNTTKNREVNLHNYTYTFYGKCEKAKKQ